jgi:Zn-dependent peptidase ImmA (M78 family)
MQVIEDNGGIIIPFDFETPKIDAMSITVPDLPPLFFVNMESPVSRLRFTLCHELAHVIMHQRDVDPDMELQADRFASEFLLPSKEIRPYLRELSLPKLGELKTYWKASMQAILKKATTLNTITESQARSLWIKLSANGFKTHEPFEDYMPKENPTLYNEIIDVYRQDYGYTLTEFSEFINMIEDETKTIYYYNDKPRLSLVK